METKKLLIDKMLQLTLMNWEIVPEAYYNQIIHPLQK